MTCPLDRLSESNCLLNALSFRISEGISRCSTLVSSLSCVARRVSQCDCKTFFFFSRRVVVI